MHGIPREGHEKGYVLFPSILPFDDPNDFYFVRDLGYHDGLISVTIRPGPNQRFSYALLDLSLRLRQIQPDLRFSEELLAHFSGGRKPVDLANFYLRTLGPPKVLKNRLATKGTQPHPVH